MPPIVDSSAILPEGLDSKQMVDGIDPVHEIRIKDKLYDISEFKKRHPGGSVITYFLGQDATEAFNAFHAGSNLVSKYLKAVPSRSVTEDSNANPGHKKAVIQSYQEIDPLVADFEKLRQDCYAEGLFEPSVLHIVYRLVEMIVPLVVGLKLFWGGWIFSGMLIITISGLRGSYLMHETGHYSLTSNRVWDRRIQEFVGGFLVGISGSYWRNQHNKHHATPQKMKHDIDLRTLPLVAFNQEVSKDGPWFWLRWQAYSFVPIIPFLVISAWQFFLHPRYSIRTNHKFEMAVFAFRYYLVFTWILADYTILQAIAVYLGVVWMGSNMLLVNFALNHTHTPVVHEDEKLDWVRFAVEHTVDIEHTLWCTWWMGYLNYQIEHHLFPSMPQFRNKLVVPRVRALLEKHGIEYRVLSYWDALKVTFGNLDKVGKSPVPQKAN